MGDKAPNIRSDGVSELLTFRYGSQCGYVAGADGSGWKLPPRVLLKEEQMLPKEGDKLIAKNGALELWVRKVDEKNDRVWCEDALRNLIPLKLSKFKEQEVKLLS